MNLAAEIFKMFNAPAVVKVHQEEYDHVPAFTQAELDAWVAGNAVPARGYQVVQVASAVGARLVDRKLADAHTVATYKAMWELTATKGCAHCKKTVTVKLMMGGFVRTCGSKRCIIKSMRED